MTIHTPGMKYISEKSLAPENIKLWSRK